MSNEKFFELNFKLNNGDEARIVRTFDRYELWLPNPNNKVTGYDCISGNYDVIKNTLMEGKDSIFEFDTVLSLFERNKFYTGCMDGLGYSYYDPNNELLFVDVSIRDGEFHNANVSANVGKVKDGIVGEIVHSFYRFEDTLEHILNTYPKDAPMDIRRYLSKVLKEIA